MATPSSSFVPRRFSLWARAGDDGAATFDSTGRLLTFRFGADFYRRGLDNRLLHLERLPGSPNPWTARQLAHPDEQFALLRERLADLPRRASSTHGRALADRALAGLADNFEGDACAFRDVIGPVPIVPPNHSRSVVLRLTEGCQYNACGFCELYKETRFRVRPTGEWRRHVRDVLAYFGDGAGIRPAIWIGDASALEATAGGFADALEVCLEEGVRVVADGEREAHLFKGDDPHLFEGIYAFADVPRAARLDVAEGRRLRQLGLKRFYLGVESGHPELLRLMRKPHTSKQVREAVRRLHATGIAAGVILLVGPGGKTYTDEHRTMTADLVASLDLGGEDFVFLSPLDSASRTTEVGGDDVLDDHELALETRRLREALIARVGRRIRIADYGLESFVY